jgi:predicted nucleic acid-binding protein
MKRSVLADTGPLYAAADPDDQYHDRAQRELKRLNRDKRSVVVAYPILLESYTLVLYRLGKEVAATWLGETMAGASLVNPAAEDYRVATAKVLSFKDQPITLFDATVAVLAQRTGLQVWTYDHHFDVMRVPVWR